ncbi:MAG: hypothetical protein ABIS39_00460 [Sphingomicrobium sp.]
MSPLMAYFWPSIAAGMVVGAIALTIIFRRRLSSLRKWLAVDVMVLIAVLLSLVWSGPLGGGRKFIDNVEPAARETLDYYEMTEVKARLGQAPLTRELILEGPADDFQRSELVRVMSQIPGVSRATWKSGNGAWPIILEGALMAVVGLLLGALLAYLLELHRRYNAQWRW